MTSKDSIKDIKDRLTHAPSDAYLERLKGDERKGVKKLIEQYNRQLIKDKESREAHTKRLINEKELSDKGYQYICGIDEVGRGPLAGPVVSSAVILGETDKLVGLTDSKMLSKEKRNYFYQLIQETAVSIGVGIVTPEIIDQVNIYQATILAMEKAVSDLHRQPDYLLVDAMKLPRLDIDQNLLIKGDQLSLSIAAASVVAKVTRDRIMADYHAAYPDYDFINNQGYGTAKHLLGLQKVGVCPIHRKTFAPIKDLT